MSKHLPGVVFKHLCGFWASLSYLGPDGVHLDYTPYHNQPLGRFMFLSSSGQYKEQCHLSQISWGRQKEEGELPGGKQYHGIWISGDNGFLTYQPGDYSKCSEHLAIQIDYAELVKHRVAQQSQDISAQETNNWSEGRRYM